MKQPADYQFRRVTIDLGGGDIHQEHVSCQDLEDFLGGIGRSFKLLGAYEVTDAFAPSSPLIMSPPYEGLIAVVGENVQSQPGADFRQVVTGSPRPIAGGPTDADCHFKMLHSAPSLDA